MQGRKTFTGSSSSSQNSKPNYQNSQNVFQGQSPYSAFKTSETWYFGDCKITSPYSPNLCYPKINESLSRQSQTLIHSLFSYKQHFAKPNVPAAFEYPIRALNIWLSHLEEYGKKCEETIAELQTKLQPVKTLNPVPLLKTKETKKTIFEEHLQKQCDSLQTENETLRNHFRLLKQKYDALKAQTASNTKETGSKYSPTILEVFFSKRLQNQLVETIKETFDENIQDHIFGLKQKQELPIWVEIANLIQTINLPCLEKHFEHGCLKHPYQVSCFSACDTSYEICQLEINLDTFQTIFLPEIKLSETETAYLPETNSTFVKKFGLTFGFLLDLGLVKAFRFTGSAGHNKLRVFLGDEHYLVRTTSHFLTNKNKKVQVTCLSVPPAWENENQFFPTQTNFLISNESTSWYETFVPFTVRNLDYYNWRIHQSARISERPPLKYRLICQSTTARYYGTYSVTQQIPPYVNIKVTAIEEGITENLDFETDDMCCLPGESQNDDIEDIDWETMKD